MLHSQQIFKGLFELFERVNSELFSRQAAIECRLLCCNCLFRSHVTPNPAFGVVAGQARLTLRAGLADYGSVAVAQAEAGASAVIQHAEKWQPCELCTDLQTCDDLVSGATDALVTRIPVDPDTETLPDCARQCRALAPVPTHALSRVDYQQYPLVVSPHTGSICQVAPRQL
jgi:hypothetical protein